MNPNTASIGYVGDDADDKDGGCSQTISVRADKVVNFI